MKSKKLWFFVLVMALVVFVSSYRLDAYISRPGDAYELSPLVEVEGRDEGDEGTLSLMTVTMFNATPALYIMAQFQEGYKVLDPEQVRSPHESDEEYNVRQLKLMSDSQVNALQVAFEEAGKPYEVSSNGVFILNVLEDGAAAGLLSPGDRLLEIDDQAYDSMEDFLEYLGTKKVGDKVELVIERDNRTIKQTVTLAPLPTEPERAGIGISFVEDKEIETTPDVSIDSDTIGGPSAGLMFTLEILNQLLDEDITHGYDIAGTGTMESDGTVGPIGGIDQKVIAADRAGIDVFFAPDHHDKSERPSNFDVAVETAEEIGTEMDIVPVADIDAALDYLSELSPQ
ncbi:PDZ domain-containing protein [Planococcus sp. CP5-4]|uniref:SepM family pheromone-processing serine protease n=1 Tax=unclassified Planococcus (in: firmicutes) TaxID=2662419 RepID=UPI001C2307A6|nr:MULTISPECIES: SepM family pheromone-processing serine protease [unclassified Planococcus (in: firmicutes)]MBU9672169.1 PDZ domain-containing protein [Planococcus sp. CP5-4_YE]MBV0907732.1 PDZ domain-containing protein [Planococcus sp. CP5-4_UN]MBW6062899.1 PDZ domain-containing protein [Planococcus sp. CP5-4]